MRYLNARTLRGLLSMPQAIEAIEAGFGPHCETPQRLSLNGSKVMAGRVGDHMGVKVVSVVPGDPAGLVVIFGPDGRAVGLVDGPTLTSIRTGAAAGLATRLCAKPNATVFALFGSGAMARDQLAAVRAVRPIDTILIWSRTISRAEALAEEYDGRAIADANEAACAADIITTATPSTCALFADEAIAKRVHINAVGAYRPDMVEVPAAVVRRAWVVVDSFAAARVEAGDLLQAGRIPDADMAGLIDGSTPVGTSDVTLFKMSGIASMDVAVAQAALRLADMAGAGEIIGSE